METIIVAVLGLISAICWGASDFLAGIASRRIAVFSVIVIAHFISLWVPLGLAVAAREPLPPWRELGYGFLAGSASLVGGASLYLGFRAGQIGAVAPFSGVVAALIPVILAILVEGTPAGIRLLGFAFGIFAIYGLSRKPGPAAEFRPGVMIYPLISGIGFGLLFVFTDLYSQAAVYWTAFAARLASVCLALLLGRSLGQLEKPARGLLPVIILAGSIGVLGNVAFGFATRFGRLDIAAVLGSFYPAVTVLLAWLVLHERLGRWQWAGVVAAMFAILLITV